MATEISTLQELQDINNNLSGDYVLVNDIDASDTQNWNQLNWRGTWQSDTTYNENDYIEESGNYYYQLQDSYTSGSSFDSSEWVQTTEFDGGSADDGEPLGFRPLGYRESFAEDYFTGTFDGQGHTISNLYINRGQENNAGLFGYADGSTIENVGLEDVDISKGSNSDWWGSTGSLVGYNRQSTVQNSYATGTVSGEDNRVGGLVGLNNHSEISNSYATGDVSGDSEVGGLVGYKRESTVSNSYSTVDVSGDSDVGSLVGRVYNVDGETDEILYSYANSDINPDLDLIGSTGIGGTLDTTGSSLESTQNMTDYENNYPETYDTWDFDNVWYYGGTTDQEGNSGYPALDWEEGEYDLTINIDGEGSTDPEEGTHTYEEGKEVEVEAIPDEGYEFDEWTGDYEGGEKEITITMDEDKEITAVFEEDSPQKDGLFYFDGAKWIETDYDEFVVTRGLGLNLFAPIAEIETTKETRITANDIVRIVKNENNIFEGYAKSSGTIERDGSKEYELRGYGYELSDEKITFDVTETAPEDIIENKILSGTDYTLDAVATGQSIDYKAENKKIKAILKDLCEITGYIFKFKPDKTLRFEPTGDYDREGVWQRSFWNADQEGNQGYPALEWENATFETATNDGVVQEVESGDIDTVRNKVEVVGTASDEKKTATVENTDSIDKYGEQSQTYRYKSISNTADAQELAQKLINAEPADVATVGLVKDSYTTDNITNYIFELYDSAFELDGGEFIVTEQEITEGSNILTVGLSDYFGQTAAKRQEWSDEEKTEDNADNTSEYNDENDINEDATENKIFRQDDKPIGEGESDGDFWVDTSLPTAPYDVYEYDDTSWTKLSDQKLANLDPGEYALIIGEAIDDDGYYQTDQLTGVTDASEIISAGSITTNEIAAGTVLASQIGVSSVMTLNTRFSDDIINEEITLEPYDSSENMRIYYATDDSNYNVSSITTSDTYVYWDEDSPNDLQTTNTKADIEDEDERHLIAVNDGGNARRTINGTVITDDLIKTDAIVSDVINSNAIVSDKIKGGAVTGNKIRAGAVSTSKLNLNDDSEITDFNEGMLWYDDTNERLKFKTALDVWTIEYGSNVTRDHADDVFEYVQESEPSDPKGGQMWMQPNADDPDTPPILYRFNRTFTYKSTGKTVVDISNEDSLTIDYINGAGGANTTNYDGGSGGRVENVMVDVSDQNYIYIWIASQPSGRYDGESTADGNHGGGSTEISFSDTDSEDSSDEPVIAGAGGGGGAYFDIYDTEGGDGARGGGAQGINDPQGGSGGSTSDGGDGHGYIDSRDIISGGSTIQGGGASGGDDGVIQITYGDTVGTWEEIATYGSAWSDTLDDGDAPEGNAGNAVRGSQQYELNDNVARDTWFVNNRGHEIFIHSDVMIRLNEHNNTSGDDWENYAIGEIRVKLKNSDGEDMGAHARCEAASAYDAIDLSATEQYYQQRGQVSFIVPDGWSWKYATHTEEGDVDFKIDHEAIYDLFSKKV